jgi:uncharacterized membrane protein
MYPLAKPFRAHRSCELAVTAGIAWLSWVVRLRGLGVHSLWLDEALEVGRAMAPWPELLRSRLVDLDPPVYSSLMHLWLGLGANDFFVRVPSVVFGVLATVLMLVWLRRHGPPALALLGAVIFALAPVQVHYAQEVNQYSLVGLLAVATLLAFDDLTPRPPSLREKGGSRAFILVSALDLYTYYGLVWLVLALDAVWLVHVIRRGGWRRWSVYQVAMVLVALSLLPFSLEGHVLRGLAAWKGQYAQLGRGDVVQQFIGGVHGSLFAFSLFPFSHPPDGLMAAIYGLLALGALTIWRWRGEPGRLIIPLWLSPALAFIASGYGLYAFQGRHLLFAAPLVYALLAAGLWPENRKEGAEEPKGPKGTFGPFGSSAPFVPFFLLTAFCLLPSAFWPQPPSREELRPVLAQVRQASRPDDAIYVYYAAVPAFRYYQAAGLALQGEVYVESGWPQGEISIQVAHAATALAGHSRGWLIFVHIAGNEDRAILDGLTAPGSAWHLAECYRAENAAACLVVS